MFLKILTTAFVVCGLALLFAMPALVGSKPGGEDKLELAQYGTRLLTYFVVTSAVWIGAAVGAIMVARRARLKYLEEQRENLTGLIEGALRDHERKK